MKIYINISQARIYPQVCWSLWVKQVLQYWSVHGLPCQQSLDNKGPSHKIRYRSMQTFSIQVFIRYKKTYVFILLTINKLSEFNWLFDDWPTNNSDN